MQQFVTVRDLITGTEHQAQVITWAEWAEAQKAALAAQFDRENPGRRNPWKDTSK